MDHSENISQQQWTPLRSLEVEHSDASVRSDGHVEMEFQLNKFWKLKRKQRTYIGRQRILIRVFIRTAGVVSVNKDASTQVSVRPDTSRSPSRSCPVGVIAPLVRSRGADTSCFGQDGRGPE